MLAPVLYSGLLGSKKPVRVLAATPGRIEELVRGWDAKRWSRSYGRGKWNAAQIVLHLAHDEIGSWNRVRFALSTHGYVMQPYDGAAWVALETPVPGPTALAAFAALRRLNVMLCKGLSPRQLARRCRHPLLGEISVEWIIQTLAGHDLHHLQHLEAIAGL